MLYTNLLSLREIEKKRINAIAAAKLRLASKDPSETSELQTKTSDNSLMSNNVILGILLRKWAQWWERVMKSPTMRWIMLKRENVRVRIALAYIRTIVL